MSNLDTGLEQIKQLLRNVGKETLSAVGPARGAAASRKYADVFASKLAIELELKMSNPVVVLTNFETEITIEGDTKIVDKPFPVAVVAYVNESGIVVKPPILADLENTAAIEYNDFKTVDSSNLTTNVLMVLDLSTRTKTPYIPKLPRNILVARAKRVGAKLFGIINFGYHITIWFPDLASMVDTTRLANRPEAIQQIQSDPQTIPGLHPDQPVLPCDSSSYTEKFIVSSNEKSDLVIDPKDISLDL
jgi:hypothetical protein